MNEGANASINLWGLETPHPQEYTVKNLKIAVIRH